MKVKSYIKTLTENILFKLGFKLVDGFYEKDLVPFKLKKLKDINGIECFGVFPLSGHIDIDNVEYIYNNHDIISLLLASIDHILDNIHKLYDTDEVDCDMGMILKDIVQNKLFNGYINILFESTKIGVFIKPKDTRSKTIFTGNVSTFKICYVDDKLSLNELLINVDPSAVNYSYFKSILPEGSTILSVEIKLESNEFEPFMGVGLS